jgi:hypothetical protein
MGGPQEITTSGLGQLAALRKKAPHWEAITRLRIARE